MKVCVLGDTHFGARNDSVHFSIFFEKFYKEIFFPYMEQHNIKHVIQLGDVFDRRKYINFQTLNHCKDYFFKKLNNEYSSWLLVGNHDAYYKNTNDVNSLDMLLGEYSNINLITKPTELELDNTSVLLLPWICDDNFATTMETINSTKAQVAFGHLELTGFEMYKGQLMDHGMDPNLFGKFDMVVSGHYHHKSHAKNVTYTGTPYEMTWSDYGDLKGFHIFDTETRELEFISNPFKMFHKLHYDDLNQPVGYVNTWDLTDMAGAYVKVIVRNKTNTLWFDSLIDRLEKSGVSDVQVVEDHFHLDLESDDDIVSQAEDTLTILRKYVDQIDSTVNKPRLENLLRTLYSEALSIE